jgi:hypothetical protein
VSGVIMNLRSRDLQLAKDTGVNYMLTAGKMGPQAVLAL